MSRVSTNTKNKNRTNQAKVNSNPSTSHWRFVVVVGGIILVFVGLRIRAAYIKVVSTVL